MPETILIIEDDPMQADVVRLLLEHNGFEVVLAGDGAEGLRKLYNGFLVMASASSMVLPSLNSYANVFGSDTSDINSAMISATRLEEISSKNPTRLSKDALSGLQFSATAPANGKAGKKVWSIPYDFKGACNEAAQVCLGVPYFNWGPRYVQEITKFQNGTWTPTWYWDGPDWKDIANPDTSAVGFTFGKALSDANKTTVQTFIKGMGDGSINLFKGPITLQDNSVYVKEGATATDKEIWYLPQLLQGMTGASAPTK